MIHYTSLNGGKIAGLAVCEVSAVPNYELLDSNIEKAAHINQVMFSQIVTGFFRRFEPDSVSLEILWHSVPVANQTYKAQVKQYILIRHIGTQMFEIENNIKDACTSLSNELREKNYSIKFLKDESEYLNFSTSLKTADTQSVLSVTKKESYAQNPFMPNTCIYYNDMVYPSIDENMDGLTNALSSHPNSVISMQIIPTKYKDEECLGIEQGRTFMSYYISNLNFRQGIRADANVQAISDFYEYMVNSEKEPIYYYNLLVYSQQGSSISLANKLIDCIESDELPSGSAFEVEDVTNYGFNPGEQIELQPWTISNCLVFKARNLAFWNSPIAPKIFVRLKQLITARDLSGFFKLPFEGHHTIGLESVKISANREKLNTNIIMEGNFKVGKIANASRDIDGNEAHAGVPLNDFTKHGLIVGMPGSGKTNFSLGLLLQFWNDFHIPFLAIEPTKSEYRALLDAIPDLQVFTPGRNEVSPFILNPFLPPKGVTVEGFIPSLMSAFKAAFSMPNPLPDIFLAAINECYNEYGWQLSSTIDDPNAKPFGLYEFIKVFRRKIRNMDYKGEVSSNMESAGVVRLVTLIEQNINIYDTVKTIPIEDLLKKPTVIELNAINNKEQKSLIMALLLIQICVYTKNNISGDGKLKNIMLIDEAHVLLSASGSVSSEGAADSRGSTIEALEDMIAEIRSYGTGIIIADQSPTKVGRNIVANTNVKVIFKLVEKENKDAISTATNMNDAEYDLLGRLGVGEAMLHYGRVYSPLHIKTYNVHDKAQMRDVIEDKEVAQHVNYWNSHKNLLIPYSECDYNWTCNGECDLALRTNADFIAARLVNHHLYKLKDKKEFIQFLVKMNPLIAQEIKTIPALKPSIKLYNCIKIRFLRKALLGKNFGITHHEYDVILRHPMFLTAKKHK